jgi:hypothetical protein
MATLGNGCPDGLLGFQGRTYMVEFKVAKGKLTPDQREFLKAWHGSPVHIIRTTEDIEALLFGYVLSRNRRNMEHGQ